MVRQTQIFSALVTAALLMLATTAQAVSIDFQTLAGVDGDTVASPISIGGYIITTLPTNAHEARHRLRPQGTALRMTG